MISFISKPEKELNKDVEAPEDLFPHVRIDIERGELLGAEDLLEYFNKFLVACGFSQRIAERLRILNNEQLAKLYLLEKEGKEE